MIAIFMILLYTLMHMEVESHMQITYLFAHLKIINGCIEPCALVLSIFIGDFLIGQRGFSSQVPSLIHIFQVSLHDMY
jgi:hypothetical protein